MKVHIAKGFAWSVNKNGERVSVETVDIQEFNSCCKLDCCDNQLKMPAKDASDSKITYPATVEIINTAGVIKLRITVQTTSGPIVKEI